MTPTDAICQKWKNKEPAIGLWLGMPSPLGAELASISGCDYVCIDQQHGLIGYETLVSMLFALLFVGLLYLLLRRTVIGRAIVAVRMDRYAAALMGVNTVKVFAVTFALGAALAGAAGALLSPIFPISPLAGTTYLGKAFVICVLGGLGSVSGALVGGLVLGILESFGALFFGPEHSLTLSFTVLILLLIFRPNGIMGKRGFV